MTQPTPPPIRSLSPAPGVIEVRGKGWSFSASHAIAIAILAALGARFLPTQTTTDSSIERVQVTADRRALEDERFREEQRQALRALRDQLNVLDTRLSALEAAKAAPRPSGQ